eukprot:3799674-Lingulodinium_polyedra.AAC.1
MFARVHVRNFCEVCVTGNAVSGPRWERGEDRAFGTPVASMGCARAWPRGITPDGFRFLRGGV